MQRDPPHKLDTEAYVSIFISSTATASGLKNFGLNAEKGLIKAKVAAYLSKKRFLYLIEGSTLIVPKANRPLY